MEKWKSRGKGTKAESVLPPTRRPAGPACLPMMDKKKDRKWSFGGLLRRISSGQNHEASSNDEDITYIPGHMLSKRSTRKPSRMKSKLGKIPHRVENAEVPAPREESFHGSRDTLEIIRSLKANVEQSQDSLCPCNDSVNSRSSEGSLDAAGKTSRINRMKARAQAKRDRLRGDSSSDDDSHRSSQSLGQFRSDDTAAPLTRTSSRKIDPCAARRTRGARTERYVRRMYRDDGTSGSESRMLESSVIPSPSVEPSRFSTTPVDSNFLRSHDAAPGVQGGSSPSIAVQRDLILEKNLPTRETFRHPHEPRASQRATNGYLKDMNENETFEREKLTWPQHHLRRTTPTNGIYGSLGQPKVPPPEPPPRSSKSRVFSSFYGNAPCAFNVNHEAQPVAPYPSPLGTRNARIYNSDNELLLSDHVAPVRLRHLWLNSDENRRDARVEPDTPYYSATSYCNSLDRPRGPNYSRRTRDFREEQENRDPRPYHQVVIPPPSNFAARSTSSLPKGVQLFSRQRLSHCGGDDDEIFLSASQGRRSPSPSEKPLEDRIIPKLRGPRAPASCRNPTRTPPVDDEAERKRSSKNLEDALSELEAIYNSLRLSDEDLLERAEQRSMEEYRDRAARSAAENSRRSSDTSSIDVEDGGRRGSSGSSQQQQQRENDARMKDDMAYRRMNPKERPPSVNGQASLSQISYLATSPNLSTRDADYLDQRPRSRRGTPDPTRDDLLYRSISRANNQLRVIEPQPPFGIPLGPVTAATESDYLHAKPAKHGGAHTRSLYIPQAEPDVVSDDLAFRNLRKDAPKDAQLVGFAGNRADPFSQADSNAELSFLPRNATAASGSSKKRATRSMSADLYGIVGRERSRQSDWYSEYIQSTQKLRFVGDDVDVPPMVVERANCRGFEAPRSKSPVTGESADGFLGETDRLGLDINGNRPKSALQRKIQVYVPQETTIAETVDAKLEKSRDVVKSIGRESDASSPEHCDSSSSRSDVPAALEDEKTKTIESFTEQELSEYKQLCQDLEKLIQRTGEPDTKDVEEEDEEVKKLGRESEEDEDSQSEFDELEKLLIDDYELPASIAAAFDEIVEATSVGRDDDGSSSRSTGLGADSLSSDNFQSSPGKTADRIPEDDASSASELGTAGSGNTGSSFNDSVYDKFNQLLREVNDVPYVEPKKTFAKYPVDELDAATNILASDGSNDEPVAEGSGVAAAAEETRETSAHVAREDPEAKTEATGAISRRDEHPAGSDMTWRGLRARRTEDERDGDERKVEERRDKPANRQG